jgi:hypothetical protein
MKPVSRRGLLEGVAVLMSAGIAAPLGADEALGEAEKISHADALYQMAPKGQQRCAICLQFAPPGRCKIVRSPIYPTGWCQYFAARENAH